MEASECKQHSTQIKEEIKVLLLSLQMMNLTFFMQQKKRAPTALTVECGVCLGPAPDHLHFGGRSFI